MPRPADTQELDWWEPAARAATSCARCGERPKRGVALKRCSGCKQAWYCSSQCQQAAWKQHKKVCSVFLPLRSILDKLNLANNTEDWREVIKYVAHMEELLENQCDATCELILRIFATAYCQSPCYRESLHVARLQERRVVLLGNLGRFRDQGEAMNQLALNLMPIKQNKQKEAGQWFERMRKLGEQHFFFSMESRACLGLGKISMDGGNEEEGLGLIRNALVAASLDEIEDGASELCALEILTNALVKTNGWEELEELLPRCREVAQADARKTGEICTHEFKCCYLNARLHEVNFPSACHFTRCNSTGQSQGCARP